MNTDIKVSPSHELLEELKLMLEKQITAQMYNILQNTIEAKQGGYNF